ncbi:SPARC-related modular calcium-binding protein 1 [Frankliniella fusca]|uniref:SPARC-related modular calcium-binding protein 1 n=1 Tax=Frankliniella fusca TaxID=407009 RepID=A0AAE1HIC1_9NEOP|nr:SPARC-related modular calcium-binding protein 1 [Frankliniella fusca]
MPTTTTLLQAVLAATLAVLLTSARPTLGAALGQDEPPTTTPPSAAAQDAASSQAQTRAESCQAEQSRCESELALQAGRVGPGPVPGGRPGRPVCGSDNTTYDNDCHLKRVQCEGRSVEKAHLGKCKDHTPCLSYRRRASRAGYASADVFLPQCQGDGSFSPLQCHEESGYCWCVTPQGRQVLHTAVKGRRPNCTRPAKTRRGSGPRGPAGAPRGAWRRQRRACGRGERANFKKNLIEIFRTEYRRAALASGGDTYLQNTAVYSCFADLSGTNHKQPSPARVYSRTAEHGASYPTPSAETRPGPGPGPGPEMDLRVLEWKFDELDKNGDGQLRRPEYQELRRAVRNKVTPKPCARTFTRRCDLNNNKIISKQEWEACLGHELHLLQDSVSSLSVQLPGLLLGDNLERREEPEVTDCLTDRQAVLEEQRAAKAALYIPECTEDGRYNKLQCYNSTGYCWCVNEDTGKPITGTSVKDRRPACDALAPTMKGCPEVRRKEFLKNLREFFKERMQAAMNETDTTSSANGQVSREDRIATWNFLTFDKNKNKRLDRPEWKAFRQLVSGHQMLRRCGKKLPRYCDVNQDRAITIDEWLVCLRTPTTVEAVTVASHSRRGPNPLDSYLKSE